MSWESILKTPYRIIVYEGSHETFKEQLDDGTMKKNMEKHLGTFSLPLENSAIEVHIDKKGVKTEHGYKFTKNLVEYMAIGINDFIERSKRVYSAFSFRLKPNDIILVFFKKHMPQKGEGKFADRVNIPNRLTFSQKFQEANKMQE